MKAVLSDGTVVAEAAESELIKIEGNWYFPPASVDGDLLEKTDTPYTCPWKGEAQYFSVQGLQDRAWSYPTPYPTAFERVGRDFSNYVAFWKEVSVVA